MLCGPWAYQLLRLDPASVYAAFADRMPILALFGALDTQVAADVNADAAAAVDGIEVRVIEGANHLFQPAATGAPAEYAQIETTMSEDVMAQIAAWIAGASR